MYRYTLLILTLVCGCRSLAQRLPAALENTALEVQMSIVADKRYSITDLADSRIPFMPMPDSLTLGRVYWLKIEVYNASKSTEGVEVSIMPQLRNTLYRLDSDKKVWIASRTDAANNHGSRLLGKHLVYFTGKERSVVLVKMDLTGFGEINSKVKLRVSFAPAAPAIAHEQTLQLAWVCCIVVILIFLINNLYVYWSFKDKAVLYYLIAQLGGIVYITAYRWKFNQFLKPHVFNIDVHEAITYYDVNKIIIHLAVVLVLYAISSFTRVFLDTKRQLPKFDKWLRYGANTYAVVTICVMMVNLAGYNIEYYTLPYDNLFCALIISLIMATGVAAFIKKLPFAATFLMANGVPFIFILCIPLSHVIISLQNEENLWIPELAVVTHALAFSIALVTRTKAIQSALSESRMVNQQLQFSLREAHYRAKLHCMEIEKIGADMNMEKVKNDLLQERLETKQRELTSATLNIVQKNELLNHLKSQMQVLSRPNPSTSEGMRAMSKLIDNSMLLDSDWTRFKVHFEQVHPHFFESLKANHPTLTTRETRLYAYFHMQLSHREIAALLNIDPASVRRAKTRLFKKMAIPETD